MIIFLSWCSCNIVSPVLPRLSSYGTQACDLYTWDGPNSGIPSVKRSVWSGCIFQNWFYFNQCVYIRNPQTLLSHYPQTIPNHDHIHHSENRKRSSHVCNPPYNHGPHSYLLHLNYCKASDYVVMVTYTGRTLRCHLSLSLSFFAAASWPPSYPVFFCWVWRNLKYVVFTFPNTKLLFNDSMRSFGIDPDSSTLLQFKRM